jgi:hypothetical protein
VHVHVCTFVRTCMCVRYQGRIPQVDNTEENVAGAGMSEGEVTPRVIQGS